MCVRCKDEERLVKATVVDHIRPHRGDKELFWDKSNWQGFVRGIMIRRRWLKIDIKNINIERVE